MSELLTEKIEFQTGSFLYITCDTIGNITVRKSSNNAEFTMAGRYWEQLCILMLEHFIRKRIDAARK